MPTVVLTGAASALGRRVLERLAADADVDRVVELDLTDGLDHPVAELKAGLEGAAVLVHLGRTDGAELDGTGTGGVDVEGTRHLFEAAGAVGVDHVVVLSSATVYGAWPNNPVPLTEEAPVRPNPGLAYATHKAEVERLAHELVESHPAVGVTILRPTVAVAEERTAWLAQSLWSGSGLRPGDAEAPSQYVHLDDLADAVDLARRERLRGVFNVAPDGWIKADDLRALAGRGPNVRLPERLVTRVAAWRWKFGLTPTPPGVVAYLANPWVVANDRLKAAGWSPRNTNEEAYVSSHRPTGWAALSGRRRQEVALAGVGAGALVGVLGVVLGVRALLRRRSR
ncbi:MAG: NAD-dependent epimerase/dehydratase family protein [Acidimicrobiales bacterium]|nr:NAD-dependent epimerase/dehydratase family protein [Acidimicrobiales bacterium]